MIDLWSRPPLGGTYMLGVNAEVREKAGVTGGDIVDVDLELDTDERVVTVPPIWQRR